MMMCFFLFARDHFIIVGIIELGSSTLKNWDGRSRDISYSNLNPRLCVWPDQVSPDHLNHSLKDYQSEEIEICSGEKSPQMLNVKSQK